MVSSRRPTRRTVSGWDPETEECTHVFEISRYSLHEVLEAGGFVDSAKFTVGGHDWFISYYPSGCRKEANEAYVSIYLNLMSKASTMPVSFDLRLVNPATDVSSSVRKDTNVFSTEDPVWGFQQFKKKSELEASYLRDDCLVIECDVTVSMGTPVSKSEIICDIQVPSSVLLDNLGKLLEFGEEADVAFKVKDEVFRAHRLVLAMQSPVFKAQLYGPMSNRRMDTIVIQDIQPSVFKALLHLMYKDSLPSMEDLDGDEIEEMGKHLLVAADMYAVERMKVMCESILAKTLDIEGVADTLLLADQSLQSAQSCLH